MKSGKGQAIEIGDAPAVGSAYDLLITAEGQARNVIEVTALCQSVEKLRKCLLGLAAHHEIDRRVRLQGGDIGRGCLRPAKSDHPSRMLAFDFAGDAQRDR